MRQLLVAVDPHSPARTRSAVQEAVQIWRDEFVGILLVRVQPRLSGHVAMFFGTRELQKMQLDEGAEELKYAQSLLDAAGVPYTSTVLIGRSAETIAQAAREYGCDRILFGEEGPSLAGKMFGSLAEQVRHLLGPGNAYQVIGS
jgi:nucleotide-binding universal stress UspA family protein